MIIPMFLPSMSSYSGHSTTHVHNHFNTRGIEKGLGELTKATDRVGDGVERIGDIMSEEKHLITVLASEIHGYAVEVGQYMFDVREDYVARRTAAAARVNRVMDKRQKSLFERRVRNQLSEAMAHYREADRNRTQLIDDARHAFANAENAAMCEFHAQRGFRMFRKPMSFFLAKHNCEVLRRDYGAMMEIPHPINSATRSMVASTGHDPWPLWESVVETSIRAHNGVWVPRALVDVRDTFDHYYIYGRKNAGLRSYIAHVGGRDNWVAKAVPTPAHLDLVDELCQLAEVSRFTPSAQIQVRASTLVAMSEIFAHIISGKD